MRYDIFAAQFRSQLGDEATKTLYYVRMAAAGLGFGTILLTAVVWLASGPGIALWLWLVGWTIAAVIAVVGILRVLAEVPSYQQKDVTFGDLVRMGAIVSSGQRHT